MENPIIHHNHSIATAYQFWSPSLNIHFGYWKWGINPFDREAMLQALNEVVVQALACRHDEAIQILDAGCGTGATLRYIAQKLPKAQLYGISLAPGLLALGEHIHRQNPAYHPVQLTQGDFQDMPYPAAFFDAVVAMESVCYGRRAAKEALTRELARVLKTNGRLVVVDVFRKTGSNLPWPFELILKRIEKTWAIEATGVLPQFIDQLKAHGFEIQTIRNLSLNTLPSAAHIPWVVFRLLLSALLRSDENRPGKLTYAKALGTTLLTGLLAPFMGYYLIVADKSAPQGDK